MEELTSSLLPMELFGNTTSPSPVESVVKVMAVVDAPPKVRAAAPPGRMVKAAVESLSAVIRSYSTK